MSLPLDFHRCPKTGDPRDPCPSRKPGHHGYPGQLQLNLLKIAMEIVDLHRFTMIYPWKMVIFHSYVCPPGGGVFIPVELVTRFLCRKQSGAFLCPAKLAIRSCANTETARLFLCRIRVGKCPKLPLGNSKPRGLKSMCFLSSIWIHIGSMYVRKNRGC